MAADTDKLTVAVTGPTGAVVGADAWTIGMGAVCFPISALLEGCSSGDRELIEVARH